MPNFFDDHSPFLNHPLLTAERSKTEVDQLISILDVEPPAHVLDLGCGFGRHSIEFARQGFGVTGVDPSEAMIAAAQKQVGDARVDGVIFSADLAEISSSFDAAVAMFTTIGQVGEDNASNEGVVGEVADRLRPGARFVVEVPQRGPAVSRLVEHDEFGSGQNSTEITRRYDEASRRVHETFRVVSDGVERFFDLTYRLFDRVELEAILSDSGLEFVSFSSNLDGESLSENDPTMIAVARRPT